MYRDESKNEKYPDRVDARPGHQEKINSKLVYIPKNKGRALSEQVIRALLLIETALMAAGLSLLAIEIVTVIGGLV